MSRTFFYLGGDSYPAEHDWEEALRQALDGAGTRFIRHRDFHRAWPTTSLPSIDERFAMAAEGVAGAGEGEIFLIGRSAGARVATLIAADNPRISGVICLFYPFRAPGRRIEPQRFMHLAEIKTPTLIFQGATDDYGGVTLTEDYELSEAIRLRIVPGGHDLSPKSPAGRHIVDQIPAYLNGDWRDPSQNLATFDEHFYLWANPGIADAVADSRCPSGLQHFQSAGRREGKKYRMRVETV